MKVSDATELFLPKQRMFTGPATLWKRVFAFLSDLLILDILVLWPFRKVIISLTGSDGDFTTTYALVSANPSLANVLYMVLALIFLFVMIYFVVLDYVLGQTLGMMLFNIKTISDMGGTIGDLSLIQSLSRNIFIIPVIPFILLWIIDPIFLIFNKNNQRLTEYFSNTLVVEQFAI